MRILLLTDDMLISGVNKYIADLAEGLIDRGHEVVVAATDGPYRSRLSSGVTFVPLGICRQGGTEKDSLGIPGVVHALYKTIRHNRIEIVHSQKRYSDLIAWLLCRLTGIEHLSTCHNEFTNLKRISPFGDLTIAPCPKIAQMLVETFGKNRRRIRIVPYGTKPLNKLREEQSRTYRQSIGIGPQRRIILSVAHIISRKDRPTLIEAIKILKESGKFGQAICVIVGEGDDEPLVRLRIQRYELEEEVRILPATSNIEALNNIAEFCVLSSLRETWAYVILEAASIAKPHIATEVGCIPAFIGANDAGICVPVKDPYSLANAIGLLLANPAKVQQLGGHAQERFNKFHSFDAFVRNTVQVYNELLSN